MEDSLQKLLDDGVIDDVRTRLMSGKEASVFIVERKGELVAAKVYKNREQRTFKATADYTEGRNQTRNTRDKRAMNKRTNYGKELIEKSWRDMEYEALTDAFHAGVRVPEPFLLYEDVLLMQLLVDETGTPAPRLADFDLPADVAELLHREIYGQVRLLLAAGKIHGDLSAFNILIAAEGPTIIDMPQVVDAAGNNSAREILGRDLRNVTEHLARFDARLLRFRDCGLHLFDAWKRNALDHAVDPIEGAIRSDTHHKSRRVRDAERGRMGRGVGAGQQNGQRFDRPRFDDRGPPGADDRGPPRADGRGPPRPDDRGPPRPDDRGPPRADDRGPPRPDARGPPRHESRGPPRPDDRGPPRPDRGPSRPDDRGPGPDHRGPPRPSDRGPPRPDDRGPPRSDPRGPPRPDDRAPPRPRDRGPPRPDDRGPPRSDDRGPPRHDRGPPRPDDRGPPRSDRGPPRPDDRGAPRHDRGPPRPDDRGPPRSDDRGPPRPDDRRPPRGPRPDRRPPPAIERVPSPPRPPSSDKPQN